MWENSEKIYEILTKIQSNQSREIIREEIFREISFILCQVSKGEALENIVIEKIKKKL